MLKHAHDLLLAVDLNGLLSILFILFSLIVYVINQVAAKGQDANKNQPRPRQLPPDPTEDEIEAFLRRATGKQGERAGRGQQPQRQPGAGQSFGGQQRPGQRGGQRAGGSSRGAGRQMPSQSGMGSPVQGRLVQPPTSKSTGAGSLASQGEQRSSIGSLTDPSTKFPTLHSSLERIDELTEERLHSTFDHALGSLDGLGGGLLSSADDDRIYGSSLNDDSEKSQEQPAPHASILELIRSPQGIRNAIIMQEILRPRSLD